LLVDPAFTNSLPNISPKFPEPIILILHFSFIVVTIL
jgi:hypothetical protein